MDKTIETIIQPTRMEKLEEEIDMENFGNKERE